VPGEQGRNRITVLYDVDLDGGADYRGRFIFADGDLSVHLSGSGSAFEPIPVERPDNRTAQFVHPVDVLFLSVSGSTEGEVQIQARTVYEGAGDRAPDRGWLRVSIF
jgi:hypothetical protein